MARRSDHTRAELSGLVIDAACTVMAEVGYARFTIREVAQRIGYSHATVHNVAGGRDDLVDAVNTATFAAWTDAVETALAATPDDRIAALVGAYFTFAEENASLWSAIFEHRPRTDVPLPDDQAAIRARLTGVVVREIAATLPVGLSEDAPVLARSLIATVHGHCHYQLSGAFALMGEEDGRGAALRRVRQALR